MVSIFRRRTAEDLARYRPLVIRPLPHSSPIMETAMIWPRRLSNQPAHRWLREMVSLVTKPAAIDSKLSIENFAALPHLEITSIHYRQIHPAATADGKIVRLGQRRANRQI
jgi:hypothetical protein